MNIRAKIFGTKNAAAEVSPVVEAKAPKGAQADMLHSIPVPRDETRRGNTRGGDRHRLPEEKVRVTLGGRTYDVQLVNLSGGGAMVEGDFEPTLWDRADLHLAEDGVIECVVLWIKGKRVGLEFAHETRLDCSADEQAALLRETLGRSFADLDFELPEPLPEPKPAANEQRGERRHPLIWSGTLHYDFHSAPARLRNISSTGALVECTAPLPVGAEPLLDLGEAGSVFATVTWVVGDQAGLRFHSPFDLGQLAQSRPEVAPTKWQRPDYLKPGAGADSPLTEQWSRMSLAELRDELDGWLNR